MATNKEKELKIKQMLPPEGKGLVYIARPAFIGKVAKLDLECNGTYIGTTKGQRFIYLILNPGFYTFVSIGENKSNVQSTLEAGKTYFILQKPMMGVKKGRSELELIDEMTGRNALKKCSLVKVINIEEAVIPSSFEYTQEDLTTGPLPSVNKSIITMAIVMGTCIIPTIIIAIIALIFIWR